MFEKILPQAENLLREIIELKNKKSDENLYWNNRFGILEFDDEIVFRSLFKELRENDLINIQWASDIPDILTLTSKGRYYFDNKEEYIKERKSMYFEILDSESELLLMELLKNAEIPCTCFKPAAKTLLAANYVNGSAVIENSEYHTYYISNIEHKGRMYFEMKERYEQEMEKQRSIIINATDGSPVNMNIGSGTAIQNINNANTEQLKALQDFVSMINHTDELTAEQKKEVLELIDEIKANQQSGKKIIIKSLLSCITPIVSVVKTLKENWEMILSLFN